MKKIPLRRCVGCFESKPKNELYRIVKTADDEIILDKTGKKNGRGAYICSNKGCLEKVIKSKRLEREFETRISEEIYDELRSMIENN